MIPVKIHTNGYRNKIINFITNNKIKTCLFIKDGKNKLYLNHSAVDKERRNNYHVICPICGNVKQDNEYIINHYDNSWGIAEVPKNEFIHERKHKERSLYIINHPKCLGRFDRNIFIRFKLYFRFLSLFPEIIKSISNTTLIYVISLIFLILTLKTCVVDDDVVIKKGCNYVTI